MITAKEAKDRMLEARMRVASLAFQTEQIFRDIEQKILVVSGSGTSDFVLIKTNDVSESRLKLVAEYLCYRYGYECFVQEGKLYIAWGGAK